MTYITKNTAETSALCLPLHFVCPVGYEVTALSGLQKEIYSHSCSVTPWGIFHRLGIELQ